MFKKVFFYHLINLKYNVQTLCVVLRERVIKPLICMVDFAEQMQAHYTQTDSLLKSRFAVHGVEKRRHQEGEEEHRHLHRWQHHGCRKLKETKEKCPNRVFNVSCCRE